MSLKIGAQARKERGLLPEKQPIVASVVEEIVSAVPGLSIKNVLADLDLLLMGVEVNGKEARLVEVTVEGGKVISVNKGKLLTVNDAKYAFKIESAKKILSSANKGSK